MKECVPSRRVNRLTQYGASLFIAMLGVLAFAGFGSSGGWVLGALTLLIALAAAAVVASGKAFW